MLKKISLTLACTALAFLLGANFAHAERKPRVLIKNYPDVYSTKPSLPADVPYTNHRNRDWLGGYLNGGNEDGAYNNEDDESISTSPPRHRDGQERRRWNRNWRQ